MDTFKGKKAKSVDDDYADANVGKTAVVTKDIAPNKAGEIKLQGSFWMATADSEISTGESVKVLGQISEDGLTFKVEKL